MKVALLVGPSYAEGSGISPLLYARNDAIALGQALRQVCRFDRVIVLAGTDGSDAPTRTAIVGELERLADSEEEISHFVFAFSGHGRRRAIAGQDHYFLFPADARASNPGTLLDLATVRLSLERIPAAAITLILDCCRNDPDAGKGEADNLLPDEGLAKDLGIERIPAAGTGAGGQGKALFLMNACSPGERAYENTAQKRGAFFHHLIEGIEGRQWPSGSLTVQEAFTQARDALARNPRYRHQTPTFEAPDPSRIAYLAEVGGTGPGLPPRKTNWADRRPWFAAGVATLAVAACAGWLYVERWPWLDARLCAWRAASCEPAQAALAVVTGQLREAERHYEALDRARGQAAAEAAAARVVADQARTSLSAALAAAEQATARATEAERRVQEATAARDTALAEARQAAARSAAAEGASGSAMVALRQERDAAQGRAAATERDLALAQAQARQAASQSTAAEAQVEALRRDLASVRAEAGRLGQALAAEQTAGREKDARIATLSQQRPANTAATIPNATPQLERHPRPETATGGIPNQPYAPPDRIMIRSEDRVWLLVYDNQSGRIFSNQFSSNISYLVPDAPNLVLRTNDISKLSVEIGGRGINILEGASGGRRGLSLNVGSLTSSRGRPDNVAEYVPLPVFFGGFATDWKQLPNRTEILQKYGEAVRRPPTDERAADFWHDLGRDLNILGFSDESIDALRRASRLPPHTIGRGFLYRDLAKTINARGGQGDLEEAVRLSELAINSWPYTRERMGCWDSAFVILNSYYESTNQMQKLLDTRARCISPPR